MKHLIVVAHPVEKSFTMWLTRAYTSELERIGHEQQTCDLYRMGFSPLLTAQELFESSCAGLPMNPTRAWCAACLPERKPS
jgi:NAD(P)H dehydrogenase (quinone)